MVNKVLQNFHQPHRNNTHYTIKMNTSIQQTIRMERSELESEALSPVVNSTEQILLQKEIVHFAFNQHC